jgi:putative spermidine/putrescine transport system permease protein
MAAQPHREVAAMSTIHADIAAPLQAEAPRRRRPANVGMWLVVAFCAVYFLFPIWAVMKFTIYLPKQGWTLKAYIDVLREPDVRSTFWLSVQIAFWTILLSLALMLWTVLWTTLKVRRMQPVVEFISILPYMVPPIAFVVGIAGVFRPAFPSFIANPWCLVFFYTVLAMPFTYRSLDAGLRAIDVKTLTEASRGLGAGWLATIWRVVIPNIRSALLGATFLTVAVVLGEYTIASLLLITTFSVEVAVVNQQEIFGGPALGLLSMLVVALMFAALGIFTRKRGGSTAATTIV